MEDIISEADIKDLIDSFYKKVIVDPVIGTFFTDVVRLSWEEHIPIMNNFWGSILLGTNAYHGNPMIKHIELDIKKNLTGVHFDRWLTLWESTVREHYSGLTADEAVNRAKNIAALMQYIVEQSRGLAITAL